MTGAHTVSNRGKAGTTPDAACRRLRSALDRFRRTTQPSVSSPSHQLRTGRRKRELWSPIASVVARDYENEPFAVIGRLGRSLLFDGSQTLDHTFAEDGEGDDASTELTLVGVATDVQPFDVTVLCTDSGKNARWSDLDIMAVGGSSVSVVNLTHPIGGRSTRAGPRSAAAPGSRRHRGWADA